MASFKSAAEELHELAIFHAAMCIVGLTITLAAQMSLKPAGPCAADLYDHYALVVRLTWLFACATLGAAAITGHVKRRIPDGGLNAVATAGARLRLRIHAALGGLLSATASVLSLVSFTYLVQAKTGAWHCLPAWVRQSMVATYVVVGYVLLTVYSHVFDQIRAAN